MTDTPATYKIRPGVRTGIPDGGRWLLVHHDGSEESRITHWNGWFVLGETSGVWEVASSGQRPIGTAEAKPEESRNG
jgi:hypothetical protein